MAQVDPPDPPLLAYEQTKAILAKLDGVPLVLIGGQAVNFWADHYQDRAASLVDHGPYTSKDIDFSARREHVEVCASRLGGKARVATFDDHAPNSGTVVYLDEHGFDRQIDFLMEPAGLKSIEILETSFRVTITLQGTETTFRVMHPLLCLESRVYNTARLEQYQTVHALNQLRAATICAREYVLDTLSAGDARIANRANERIYRNAIWDTGLSVFTKHGIDIFAAVVEQHPLLPPRFMSERYPHMKATLAWKRDHRRKVAAEAQRRAAAVSIKRRVP